MGITMTTTDAWGNLSVLLFYPEGRTYSPPPQGAALVSLPLVGPCALPEASTGCFSRGGRQCRQAFGRRSSLPVRLADSFRRVCLFAANRCPLPAQPATRLRKPATAQGTPFGCGSFIAVMDDASPAPSIFFCPDKRNKTAPCRGQKGSERLWLSIIWKRRS